MDEYQINSSTLALLYIDNKKTKVIENKKIYIINKSTSEIIDYNCRFFGSSYDGRNAGTKSLIGVRYKSPILIEESKNIIFFPTCSAKIENCNWISLNNIKDYYKYKHLTKVIFKNNSEIIIDLSINSFKNQIFKSTLLDAVVRKRKNSL